MVGMPDNAQNEDTYGANDPLCQREHEQQRSERASCAIAQHYQPNNQAKEEGDRDHLSGNLHWMLVAFLPVGQTGNLRWPFRRRKQPGPNAIVGALQA